MKKLALKKAPPNFEQTALNMFGKDDPVGNVVVWYAHFVIVPSLLAKRLRARGDNRACARDFECLCFTSPDTDRPHCMEIFEDCRFAGDGEKAGPNGHSPRYRISADARYDIAYTYKEASPREREEMFAFMKKAVGERLARIKKSRRVGKGLSLTLDRERRESQAG